jgi:hypothetical protein
VRGFRVSEWNEADDFHKVKFIPYKTKEKTKKGGFSYVKNERTERFYVD